MNTNVAAALSLHPVSAVATGEILGSLLESVGYGPELVMVFVSHAHRESLEEIVAAIRVVIGPHTIVGTTARAVLGDGYETDGEAAISVLARRTGKVTTTTWSGDGLAPHRDCPTLVLGTEPGRLGSWLEQRPRAYPPVVGGVAASGPGDHVTLIVNSELRTEGSVAVLFETPSVDSLLSQGTQPLGPPFTVTKSERNVVYEVAFQPATERLNQLLHQLSEDERGRLKGGIHLEVRRGATEEDALATGPVCEVLGADRSNGALAINGPVEIGDIVQFHLRDRRSALNDLDRSLSGYRTRSGPAGGALVFTSASRGRSLFGAGESDASLIAERLAAPLAGVFCDEQYGPLDSGSSVHKRSCSIVVVT